MLKRLVALTALIAAFAFLVAWPATADDDEFGDLNKEKPPPVVRKREVYTPTKTELAFKCGIASGSQNRKSTSDMPPITLGVDWGIHPAPIIAFGFAGNACFGHANSFVIGGQAKLDLPGAGSPAGMRPFVGFGFGFGSGLDHSGNHPALHAGFEFAFFGRGKRGFLGELSILSINGGPGSQVLLRIGMAVRK